MTEAVQIDDSMHTASGASSAKAVIHDRSKAWVLSVLIAINTLATVMMFVEWRMAEREARMLEYYLLELDAKFIGAGLKPADDSISKHLQEKHK